MPYTITMDIIKRIFIILLVLTLFAIVGFFALSYMQKEKIPEQLHPLHDFAVAQRHILESKTKHADSLQEMSTNVLGETIEKNDIIDTVDNPKPLHERAFEYARYQYCVQVVKDYENQKKTNNQ